MRRYKHLFVVLGICTASLVLAFLTMAVIPVSLSPVHTIGVQWYGVTVGKTTTVGAISRLGWPGRTVVQPSDMAIVYYYYDDQSHQEMDIPSYQLIFHGNALTQIIDLVPLEDSDGSLEVFITRYGKPDYVTWASSVRSGFFRSLVFLDDGVLLLVVPTFDTATSSVVEAKYFQPCSLQCIKQEFPFDFGSGPPNPEFGPLSRIDKIEDPWEFTTQP